MSPSPAVRGPGLADSVTLTSTMSRASSTRYQKWLATHGNPCPARRNAGKPAEAPKRANRTRRFGFTMAAALPSAPRGRRFRATFGAGLRHIRNGRAPVKSRARQLDGRLLRDRRGRGDGVLDGRILTPDPLERLLTIFPPHAEWDTCHTLGVRIEIHEH